MKSINRKITLAIAFLLLLLPNFSRAHTSEAVIKAAFLERFTRFIEWPEEAEIDDTTKPFIITVIGENPFGPILSEFYSSSKIRNKEVEIRYISKPGEISDCHLLFISGDEEDSLVNTLNIVSGKPVLTVSDTEGFAEQGVHINLYIADEKVRFEINETAIRNSSINVSSHLLSAAKIVKPYKDKQ
ncbi:MAG: YfiR family protein [candidate division Zixibacteria bacterium]|nr:YfiR family protein [candidate division Zixibacteria bacterium]